MHAEKHGTDADGVLGRIPPQEYQTFIRNSSALLTAVANRNRLRVLGHLIGREFAVTQLSETLGLTQSALSQHLSLLRKNRLVSTRREAQTIYYTCSSLAVVQLLNMLADLNLG